MCISNCNCILSKEKIIQKKVIHASLRLWVYSSSLVNLKYTKTRNNAIYYNHANTFLIWPFLSAQNGFPSTTTLHHTTVTVINNEICQRYFTSIPIHGSHICTGGENGRGSCEGDSGGPLTVIHNRRGLLVSNQWNDN